MIKTTFIHPFIHIVKYENILIPFLVFSCDTFVEWWLCHWLVIQQSFLPVQLFPAKYVEDQKRRKKNRQPVFHISCSLFHRILIGLLFNLSFAIPFSSFLTLIWFHFLNIFPSLFLRFFSLLASNGSGYQNVIGNYTVFIGHWIQIVSLQ